MTESDNKAPPKHGHEHDRLSVFLGDWRAEGKSYGGPDQAMDDPKSKAEPWTSAHTGRWHTGEFFLIQDEKAVIGFNPFDTISFMGVDAGTGHYFARTFENHGFYRHYDLAVDGQVWTLTGESERARITFSEDNRTQTIMWEWYRDTKWLPLCDRIAVRVT